MRQVDALLTFLKRHPKGITTWVAFDQLGITSLHSRIIDLEKAGHTIERTRIVGKNRYNNTCQVIRYRLKND